MTSAPVFVLSPSQNRALLVSQRLAPRRLIAQYALSGRVDAGRWEAAVRAVLARHEIFRSHIVTIPGYPGPGMRIGAGDEARVTVYNSLAAARSAPAPEGLATVDAAVVHAGDRSYALVRLPATHADLPTVGYIAGDLADHYGLTTPRPIELQYADVAGWLDDMGNEPQGAILRARWHEAIRSAITPPLPFRPAGRRAFAEISLRTSLPRSMLAGLPEAASERGTEALLLTIWRLLLGRITMRDEIAIAVSSSGRSLEELADLPGPLTQFLPVPGGPGGAGRLRDAVAAEQDRISAAQGLETYFSWPPPSTADSVRFIPYAFEYFPWPTAYPAGDCQVELESCQGSTEAATALLRCVSRPDDLAIELIIDSGSISPAYGRSLLTQFVSGVTAAARCWDASPRALRFMSDADARAVRAAGTGRYEGAVHAPYPHERIARMWADNPNAVALARGDRRISYGELGRRVSAMIGALHQAEVGPERTVAVVLPRGSDFVVALLGALGSAGVPVPIDPANPPVRIAQMLSALAPTVVIAGEQHRDLVPAGSRLLDPADVPADRHADVVAPLDPSSAAAVIHTSGSTGQPKRVVLTHGGLRNRIDFGQRAFPLTATDRFLWSAGVGFDFSWYELLSPLSVGATVIVPDAELDKVPAHLADLAGRQEATVAHFTPSMLSLVLAEPAFDRADGLRLIFVGGEALTVEQLRSLRARTAARVVNQYGPTEGTIDATCWSADSADEVFIGHPIDNVSTHVLGPDLELLPTGMAGQLGIGGAAVARGYAGDPALTAERFVPDPYGESGSRLYLTGDFGRRDPSGAIEFIGRRDDQISLHGYRIELGEIRAALLRCPGVGAAAAAAIDLTSDNGRLVAAVCPRNGVRLDEGELRQELAKQLPSAMMPATIAVLAQLPLTAAGKLDVGAIAIAARRPPSARPQGALEEALALVWHRLLPGQAGAAEPPGRDDDFYQLGGHSLISLQILSFVHDEIDVAVPMADMMTALTIAQLAAVVRAHEPTVGHAERAAGEWLTTSAKDERP